MPGIFLLRLDRCGGQVFYQKVYETATLVSSLYVCVAVMHSCTFGNTASLFRVLGLTL